MTVTRISVFEQINAGLDRIQQARAEAMTQPAGTERCLYLAELADAEACWWEVLFEHSHARLQWRAALVARDHARHTARCWRDRAVVQPASASLARALPRRAQVAV